MNDMLNRRLSLAALLAAASLAGCTVEVVSGNQVGTADAGANDAAAEATPFDAGAESGDANASTHDVASSDVTPDAASGDATTTDASRDGAAEAAPAADAADGSDAAVCYPEEPVAGDGGNADVPLCESLPYATDTCVATGDAGSMTVKAYGVQVCERFRAELKPSAFRSLFACLSQIPRGAENCRTDRGALCMAQVFGTTTCEVPNEALDGGTFGCAQVAASCPASDAGPSVAQSDCVRWLHPFKSAVRAEVFSCYNDPENAAVPCAERFTNYCVFPTDIRP